MTYPTLRWLPCPHCDEQIPVGEDATEVPCPNCKTLCTVDWSADDGRDDTTLIPCEKWPSRSIGRFSAPIRDED